MTIQPARLGEQSWWLSPYTSLPFHSIVNRDRSMPDVIEVKKEIRELR
jgi:hypothetical protein